MQHILPLSRCILRYNGKTGHCVTHWQRLADLGAIRTHLSPNDWEAFKREFNLGPCVICGNIPCGCNDMSRPNGNRCVCGHFKLDHDLDKHNRCVFCVTCEGYKEAPLQNATLQAFQVDGDECDEEEVVDAEPMIVVGDVDFDEYCGG